MEKLRKEHQDKVVSYIVVFTLVHMQNLMCCLACLLSHCGVKLYENVILC